MGDFDALALRREHEHVLADDIAAAQCRETDLARGPRADLAVAFVARQCIAERRATRFGDNLTERERGP